MAKIGPISPDQARKALAVRLAPVGDRLRQIATNLGARPYRVFLMWSKWSGDERDDGTEQIIQEIEILPTPLVESLDGAAFSPYNAGVVEVGTIRVSQISVVRYTEDMLTGRSYQPATPNAVPIGPTAIRNFASGTIVVARITPGEEQLPEPFDFFYEVREDGRGDNPPLRRRFRPANVPMRRATKVDWLVILEKVSEDRGRNGETQPGLRAGEEAEG